MHPDELDVLRRLEPTDDILNSISAPNVNVIHVGPFRAVIDTQAPDPWFGEAVPLDDLGSREETLRHLADLRRVFAARGLTAAIEFNEPYWPDLPGLLREGGFEESEREPLMICSPGDFRPFANPGVEVRFLQPSDREEDLVAYQSIFSEVLLDRPWEPTPDGIARIRSEVERARGRSHALASIAGMPAGTGHIWSRQGVGEINRIATLPAVRRRGVAATLTSFMMRDRFDAGDTLIWLSAADMPAGELYRKLGYRTVGDKVYFREGA